MTTQTRRIGLKQGDIVYIGDIVISLDCSVLPEKTRIEIEGIEIHPILSNKFGHPIILESQVKFLQSQLKNVDWLNDTLECTISYEECN